MNSEFREAIASFTEQMRGITSLFKDMAPGLERFEKNLKPMEEKLIASGWTIVMEMTPYHINEISELIEIKDIDDYFYEYYIDNNRENLKYLQRTCISYLDVKLVNAYQESLFAFENKKYIICANTLIPIIEGTLSSFDHTSNNMQKICANQLEECSNKDDSINRIRWNTNAMFIEKLTAHSLFSEEEPLFINRHWLMHGRSAYDITEMDCLRLLNMIGTLCNITRKL